jgi:hypothetical protein
MANMCVPIEELNGALTTFVIQREIKKWMKLAF